MHMNCHLTMLPHCSALYCYYPKQEAEQHQQSVVVCSHLPIFPKTCPPTCLVWTYEEILAALHRYPGTVVASIAGHTHQNGYLVDEAGIHHMVLPGVVEAPPGRDCYGVVEVYQDRLVLNGVDICMSCTCKLPAAAVERQQRASAAQQQQQQRQGAELSAAAVRADAGGSGRSVGVSNGAESDVVVDVAEDTAAAASKVAESVAGISLEAVAAAGVSQ